MAFEGTAFIDKQGGKYVARCPEIGVSSQADTMLEVLDQLRADVHAYLKQDQPDITPGDIHLSVMRVEVEL